MTNINKWGVGSLKEVRLPDGRVMKREENQFLFMQFGEEVGFFRQVYDDIHFLYQNTMPVTEQELISKWGGHLPVHLQGQNVKCTCGSDGVIMMEGPYRGVAMCKILAMTGFHQTSHTIKDGKLEFNKRVRDNYFMTDAEMRRGAKTDEQVRDEQKDED